MRRLVIPTLVCVALLLACVAGPASAKISHAGWPRITGDLLMHKLDESGPIVAVKLRRHNELLGGHGNDVITGGNIGDVIWDDFKPTGNTETQSDVLIGGGGRDFIYASHGHNDIDAGPGNDVVHAHFGTGGTINCGTGRDLVYVSHRSRPLYTLISCERVSYESFGH